MFTVLTNHRKMCADVRDMGVVLSHVHILICTHPPTHSFIHSLTHTQPHLWVVHVPQQAALLRVQDEVSAQEPAAALILLDVQEAADAILSIHVRHRNPDQLSPPWGITGTVGRRDRSTLVLPQVKGAMLTLLKLQWGCMFAIKAIIMVTRFVLLALNSSTLDLKWNNEQEVKAVTLSFNLNVLTQKMDSVGIVDLFKCNPLISRNRT